MRRWLRLLLAPVMVIVVVVTVLRLDPAEVLATIPKADPFPLILAGLLVLFPLSLRSFRFWLLLSRSGFNVPPAQTAAVTIYGFSLGRITPGGAGDLVRATALRPYSVGFRDGAAIVVAERAMDVAVLLALVAVAVGLTFFGPKAAFVILLGIGTGGLGLYFNKRLIRSLAERLLPGRMRGLVPSRPVLDGFFAGKTLSVTLTTTLLVFLAEGARAMLVLWSVGLDVTLAEAIVVSQLAFFAGLISLLPLGFGTWEAAIVWGLELYGHDPDLGAAAAILLRAGLTIPSIGAGGLALVWLRIAARARPGEGSCSGAAPPSPDHRK